MNRWNIPDELESKIKLRDKNCVYCRHEFRNSKKDRRYTATWEHIINDARIITAANIALCCFSCNSSKGTKKLADWLESPYCKRLGINSKTAAQVVRKVLNL